MVASLAPGCSTVSRNLSTLSWKKKSVFWLVVLAIPFLVLELGARAFFAYQLGPSMLLYGTSFNRQKSGDTTSGDLNLLAGYFKYHPHEERFTRDKETGKLIRATINAQGFRGHEFEETKEPGVIRVVTLGASSTFGFSDRDDETYPYYLEQALNRDAPGKRFQVYNLGIPHLTSGQIVALFEAEALPLHPDVVTFYEGVNDTWRSRTLFKKESEVQSPHAIVRTKLRRHRPLHQSFRWLRDHIIVVSIVDGYLKREKMVMFTAGDVEEHMQGKCEEYLANISAIRDECRRRDITFIVATQQARSMLIDREHIRGITYQQETARIREDLARDGHITRYEVDLLTHEQMMDSLRTWAATSHVPLADVIAATDQRRDCLVSWVHLSPEGNRMVARAFEQCILEQLGLTDVTHLTGHSTPAPH